MVLFIDTLLFDHDLHRFTGGHVHTYILTLHCHDYRSYVRYSMPDLEWASRPILSHVQDYHI